MAVQSPPVWQLSSNVYASSVLMANLREEETRMINETPAVPMRMSGYTTMGQPQWYFDVEPSYHTIRRYVFPKHYFRFCQRYVAAALTLKPSSRASARDKVLWWLDVAFHIANGYQALNLQFVAAHPGLDRGAVTDAWGDVSGYTATIGSLISARPVGTVAPAPPKTFRELPLSDPFYNYSRAYIQLLRNYDHAWPTVAQAQDLYNEFRQAEGQAFARGSNAPLNAFANTAPMRLIRGTVWYQFLAQGMTGGSLYWTPLSEQPGAGDTRKESRLSGPSGTQGKPYLPWVKDGATPGYLQSLGSGALDQADQQDWVHAGSTGDWIYQRALQQWRALGAKGGTLAQFINGVHRDPATDAFGRGGKRLITHNWGGDRTNLVPNFNFAYEYLPQAWAQSFRNMEYEDMVAGGIHRLLKAPTNSYTGSPLRLSNHDCQLVMEGREEFAKQAQAAFYAGVKQTGIAVAAVVTTGDVTPIIAFFGAVLYDPESVFGPRVVGCPAYGGCPGAMAGCSNAPSGPFIRSLAAQGMQIIPDNALSTTEMWFMLFVGIAVNERVGLIDFGFDLCPTEEGCIWSRSEAQQLMSQPPPSLSAQRAPVVQVAPSALQPPDRAQLTQFCAPLLDQYLADNPGFQLSPTERTAILEMCQVEVLQTGRADEAAAYLQQLRDAKAVGISLPLPKAKGGGMVPVLIAAGAVAAAAALLGD